MLIIDPGTPVWEWVMGIRENPAGPWPEFFPLKFFRKIFSKNFAPNRMKTRKQRKIFKKISPSSIPYNIINPGAL